MAVGDHDDILNRLLSQTPESWFGADHPVLNVVLEGYVNTAKFHYNDQYLYSKLQTRIKTATDIYLDGISKDFLGDLLPRRDGEKDDLYRKRILATILQMKATRPAMENALFLLTGYKPVIFEPRRDGTFYNVNCYCNHSLYGSSSMPYQCFIDVYVGAFQGMSGYGAYNIPIMSYSTVAPVQQNWYGSDSLEKTEITDADIYQIINLTKCEGTICYTRIHRGPPP